MIPKQQTNPKGEFRSLEVAELRLIDPAAGSAADAMPKITGYAATFNTLSRPIRAGNSSFKERIRPGAFTKALAAGADVRALWDHDKQKVLGRSGPKTLRLMEDAKGLAIEIDPPNNTVGRDAVESIRRGDVSQMSFGFFSVKDEWTKADDGGAIRDLIEVVPFDVSPTAFPAYEDTLVEARSIELAIATVTGAALPPPAMIEEERRCGGYSDYSGGVTGSARSGLSSTRYAFDAIQTVIDSITALERAPNDQEAQALADFADQLEDLQEKCDQADAAISAVLPPDPEEVEAQRSMEMRRRKLELAEAETA